MWGDSTAPKSGLEGRSGRNHYNGKTREGQEKKEKQITRSTSPLRGTLIATLTRKPVKSRKNYLTKLEREGKRTKSS